MIELSAAKQRDFLQKWGHFACLSCHCIPVKWRHNTGQRVQRTRVLVAPKCEQVCWQIARSHSLKIAAGKVASSVRSKWTLLPPHWKVNATSTLLLLVNGNCCDSVLIICSFPSVCPKTLSATFTSEDERRVRERERDEALSFSRAEQSRLLLSERGITVQIKM